MLLVLLEWSMNPMVEIVFFLEVGIILIFLITQKIGRTTQASLKVWIPFVYKVGNPDLFDYLGFYELNVYQDLWSDKWNFELMARKGLQFNWKGAIRSRLYYRPFKKNNQGFMLEWFNGYSESLINYKEYKSVIRIGYVIKTNEFNIFN